MASKTIAWNTGGGNITLSYSGQGNGSVSVSSSQNDSFDDRSQSVYLSTTIGSPERNVAVTITQKGKSYNAGDVFNFAYTGSVQSITLPKGRYKLQCWGAQGGSVTGTFSQSGSAGGYSEGVLTLTSTTTLYIFVGGEGASYTSSYSQTSTTQLSGGWNGGGAGYRTSRYSSGGEDGRSFPRPGGGATDIALVSSDMSYSSGRTNRTSASLLSRIIVAGGGGGASASYLYYFSSSTVDKEVTANTLSGRATTLHSAISLYYLVSSRVSCSEGEQYKVNISKSSASRYFITVYNSAGSAIKNNTNGTMTVPSGGDTIEFRIYANTSGETVSGTLVRLETETTTTEYEDSAYSASNAQGGGASGRGQYPGSQSSAGSGGVFGLGASQSVTNYRYCAGGGGGGWYGGGTTYTDSYLYYVQYNGGGSGFVNTAANAPYRPSGYTGLQLDSGTTIAGNSSFPNPNGGTEYGHYGDGYAKITVL